jgi:two-component system nitrogen regulation response regulator NtrX
VKVNCAAIPEELIESELFGAVKGSYTGATESRDGKFLQADGGTIFLDEVGDMSLRAQAKVLRALQEGEIEKVGGSDTLAVDVRVLAATNKDLAAEVAAGRFREDLFFRLNVVPITVPPLRERRKDIPLLAQHFLSRYRLENNLPPREFASVTLGLLTDLPWPGNVRELNNVVERLAIMAKGATIEPEDLQAAGVLTAGLGIALAAQPQVPEKGSRAPAAGPFPDGGLNLTPAQIQGMGGLVAARRRFEAECIRACLAAADGNVSQAARLLGIDRTNLHKKIRSYGITNGEDSS